MKRNRPANLATMPKQTKETTEPSAGPRRRAPRPHDATALTEREEVVVARVGELHDVNFDAMNAVANIYRVAGAVRNHMEREVLSPDGISWTGFTALFVLWVWGPQETRHLAEECGVAKGTLTGIMTTLESKGLITRSGHPDDGRLVLIDLTKRGLNMIRRLFPLFNRHETLVLGGLSRSEQVQLAKLLRKVLRHVDTLDRAGR
jgi:MarR family transcriptional regulator, organic hydroperoxide resistance regulator